MRVSIALVLLACAAAAIAAPGPVLPAASRTVERGALQGESALRVVDGRLLEQRLLFDSDDSRAFMAYGLASDELQYLGGGVRTPQLTAGTVELRGLLRELNRPTRFTPGSDVYRQDPGLALDATLAPTRRYGVQLQPWRPAPALFAALRDGAPESLGMHLGLGEASLRLRGLLLTTDAPADTVDDGWYTEYRRFTGGRLDHIAAELILRADRTRLAAAAMRSAGPFTAPSSAVRLHGGLRTAALRANGVWAVVQPGYVTPEGRYWRDRQQRALDLRLGRTRGAFAEFDAGQRLTRAPLRAGRSEPQRLSGAVRAGTSEAALGQLRLTVVGGGSHAVTRDERGRRSETLSSEMRLGLRRGGTVVRGTIERTWHEGDRRHDRVELRALGGHTVMLDTRLIAVLRPENTYYAGRAEVRLRARQLVLHARAATLRERTIDEIADWQSIPLSVTVGGVWSFRVPYPQRIATRGTAATTLQPSAPRVQE
ncbi:MAG: hypothetical protein EA384_03840 [Spirochaetaceae bacterium]|nr:MAG: hypothetical protein EA384_03840 [Spirochaetaceae bacterium]